jgi:membrane-associated protease RseP (regulator of RpoE activity)
MAQTTLQRLEEDIRAQAGRGASLAAPADVIPPPAPPGGPSTPGRQRAYLGAVVDDLNDHGRGVRVLAVRAGGPAARSGLRPQDLIVGVAGARIRELSELTAVVDRASPGDRLAVEVLRGGVPQKIAVTLAAQPPAAAVESLPEAIPPPAAQRAPEVPGGPSLTMPPSASPSKIPPPPLPGASGPLVGEPVRQPMELEVETLKARVQELERRVQELERALKEAKKP